MRAGRGTLTLIGWWTGKGFLTGVIVLGTWTVSGMILRVAEPLLHDAPWFWGLALLVAMAAF